MIPKVYFYSSEALISGEGRQENLGKQAITGIFIVMQIGVVNFEREYQPLHPGTKILVMPQFSNMSDQILGKNKKTQFSGQNLTFIWVPPLPKYKNVFKRFLDDQTS